MTTCPICNAKLRNVKLPDKYLHAVDKTSNYIERTCTTGMNHSIQFFTDEKTKEIDLLKFSLNPKYSKFLEIDFFNQRCRILCMKKGEIKAIVIDKMLEPDFPLLEKLNEKVKMYTLFS